MISDATLALRTQVYTQYGGQCVDCGETDPWKLTIDHQAGGGNAERRLKQQYGFGKYMAIIKAGYPKHLQLLCMNCNHAKGLHEGPAKKGEDIQGTHQQKPIVTMQHLEWTAADFAYLQEELPRHAVCLPMASTSTGRACLDRGMDRMDDAMEMVAHGRVRGRHGWTSDRRWSLWQTILTWARHRLVRDQEGHRA